MKVSNSAHLIQDFDSFLRDYQMELKTEMSKVLETYTTGVAEAVRYSLLLPSKRLRPIFCMETCQAFCGDRSRALSTAMALEMIHTYSLIHDDLPAMDNDDMRRGHPTNHKVFGEARAILAGDALLTLAFEVLAKDRFLSADVKVGLISDLSRAAGIEGMVLGQDLDIEQNVQNLQDLENLHRKKTGALLSASVVMGARAGGASLRDIEILGSFALDMGLAFQIRDDILDVEGGAEIGKPVRSDEKNDKKTYVSILGLEEAKEHQVRWTASALEKLSSVEFPYSNQLERLTRYVVERHF